jgi:hypothetical protein
MDGHPAADAMTERNESIQADLGRGRAGFPSSLNSPI